ncbi:MAG: putative TPR repeat methyltransferase [Paracoccaceae bacterium]|jgi:predicted TPR repeat methyltransferase
MTDNTELFDRAAFLADSGDAPAAAALYRNILTNQPKHLAAARALADIVEAGRASGDVQAVRRTVTDIETASTYSVGKTAQIHGRFDVAIRCYTKILDMDPDYEDAIWGLAEAHYGNRDLKQALKWYRNYSEKYPDDHEARHMVAALGDGPTPLRASDGYVRETFDHFAEDFDKQLLEDLEYRAPKLIHALFREVSPGSASDLDILDAGCGTGLSGIDFKAHAGSLTGVDLSSEMLKLAKARRLYDNLHEDELAAFMRANPGRFDLIVAADVFCYIGDLAESLEAALVTLKTGGLMIFSVEAQSKRGYSLTGSGRYAHKPAYVQKASKTAGFEEIISRTDTLRMEYGDPVKGYLTVLRKP